MILFRYFSTHALESLRDARLKVARVSSFNDPFECMYRITGDMTRAKAKDQLRVMSESPTFIGNASPHLKTKKAVQRYLKSNRAAGALVQKYESVKDGIQENREAMMDQILRVVCFSAAEATPLDEILMWSHYADSHRGVRIGFRFPKGITWPFKISPVRYQKARVEIDLSSEPSIIQEQLILAIKTKSTAWAYEREHRLITNPDSCIAEMNGRNKPIEFITIERDWVKRVDFGARHAPDQRISILDLLRRDYPAVECVQAKYHTEDYSLEYESQ